MTHIVDIFGTQMNMYIRTRIHFTYIFAFRSDGTFNFFRTNAYAFHYYETPTGLKFCITTDPLVSDRREVSLVYI